MNSIDTVDIFGALANPDNEYTHWQVVSIPWDGSWYQLHRSLENRIAWCNEIGRKGKDWTFRPIKYADRFGDHETSIVNFYFRNPGHATLFSLRFNNDTN